MTESSASKEAITIVQQGWTHLQAQRPLAAWASWQRALRIIPEFPQALDALSRLETALDLPMAARAERRFLAPDDPIKRSVWDARIQGRNLQALESAADLFASLSVDDPEDAAAWTNRGLCMAWLGHNLEAISCLNRVVQILASSAPDQAVEAWSLAEILRLGGGAEPLADDLRYAWVIPWSHDQRSRLLASNNTLQAIKQPGALLGGTGLGSETQIYEWLDRPMPVPTPSLQYHEVPRHLATAIDSGDTLRLSSPDPLALEQILEPLQTALATPDQSIQREVSPLPIALADAGVWGFRYPDGLDEETRNRITREGVEQYFENFWIHRPRHGLNDLTPLQASRAVRQGDPVAHVQLAAVVRIREQFAARPKTAALYQGYPFDRLRRRLGLGLDDPEAVDPADASCMSEEELDQLDLSQLSGSPLVEAYHSAAALGVDERTARFAARIVESHDQVPAGTLTPNLFAVLVREALRQNRRGEAFDWMNQGKQLCPTDDRRRFDLWQAELHTRSHAPDVALEIYTKLLEDQSLTRDQTLAAIEDLEQEGFLDHAERLRNQSEVRTPDTSQGSKDR